MQRDVTFSFVNIKIFIRVKQAFRNNFSSSSAREFFEMIKKTPSASDSSYRWTPLTLTNCCCRWESETRKKRQKRALPHRDCMKNKQTSKCFSSPPNFTHGVDTIVNEWSALKFPSCDVSLRGSICEWCRLTLVVLCEFVSAKMFSWVLKCQLTNVMSHHVILRHQKPTQSSRSRKQRNPHMIRLWTFCRISQTRTLLY